MYEVYTGETVEAALKIGLTDLDVEESDIRIEVIEEGSKGILGFLKKEAEVKLTIINPELKQLETIEAVKNRKLYDAPHTDEVNVDVEAFVEPEEKKIEPISEVKEIEDTSRSVEEKNNDDLKLTLEEAAESVANYVQSVVTEMGISNYTDFDIDDREVTVTIFADKAAKVIGKRGSTLNAINEISQHYFNRVFKSYGRVMIDTENYRQKRKETLENLALNMSKKAVRTNLPVHLEPMPAYERKIIHNALYNVTNIKTYSSGKEPNRHIVIERE